MSNDPLEPKTIDKDGKPPKTRFSTAQGLQSAYKNVCESYNANEARFASIRGIYDGKPPQDPRELEAQGLIDLPNINLRQHEAKVNTYVSTWTDHNLGGDKLFTVRAKHGETKQQKEIYSQQITDFFNEAIQEWDGEDNKSLAPYILESAVRDTQMGLFGIGVPHFHDEFDWRWCVVPTRKVKVPQGTKISFSNGQVVWFEVDYTVTRLYDLANSTREGWQKEAVLKLLYNRTAETRQGSSQRETFSEWQNRARNNDDFLTSDFSELQLVKCYVQEFNTSQDKDGISAYIFSDKDSEDILYRRERAYKNWHQILIPFCDNAGPEGDWHGVKGFGDQMFDSCHFNNLYFNHTARMAMVASSPMFQGSGEADRQKMSQMVWSPLGILTPDLQMQQVKVNVDLNGAMAVLGESNRTMNANSRMFPTNDVGADRGTKTATQATFDRQDQATFSTYQVKFYRSVCLDRLGAEMYRRLSRKDYPEALPGGKAAANFRKKCKDAGIPDKCWQEIERVQAARNGGSGDSTVDFMRGTELLKVATPGEGQYRARLEIARSLTNDYERAMEFVQPVPEIGEEMHTIDSENADINDGRIRRVDPRDTHLQHLGTPDPNDTGHLAVITTTQQVAMQMVENLDQVPDLQEAAKIGRVLEAALVHCQMHRDFMAENPSLFEEAVKVLSDTLNKLESFLQMFNQRVREAIAARQPQGPQLSADDQAKLMKAQIEMQIAQAWAEQEMRINEAKQLSKLGNIQEGAEAKRLEALRTAEFKRGIQEQEHIANLGMQAEQSLVDRSIQEAEAAAKTRAKGNAEKVD
jgi:hypothetical protein